MILESFESANSGANDHTESVSLFEILHIDAAVLDGHLCCGNGKLCKAIGAADVFRTFEERLRIEIVNLSANLAGVSGRIERIDRTNAANTVLQVGPKRLDVIA